MNHSYFEKWIRGYIALIVLNIVCYYLASENYLNVSVAVFAIGVLNFFATVIIINYQNQGSRQPEQVDSDQFSNGEFRRAITSSFVTVYIALIALLSTGKQNTFLNSSLMTEFTHLVEFVVLFYFGSSIIRRFPNLVGKTAPLTPAASNGGPSQVVLQPLPQTLLTPVSQS